MSRPNIDTFGRYLIIFGRFFRGMLLRADSDPGGANFYIFVPSLGLPKTTARVGSSSSIAEKKLSDVHGARSLIVYSISAIRCTHVNGIHTEQPRNGVPYQMCAQPRCIPAIRCTQVNAKLCAVYHIRRLLKNYACAIT